MWPFLNLFHFSSFHYRLHGYAIAPSMILYSSLKTTWIFCIFNVIFECYRNSEKLCMACLVCLHSILSGNTWLYLIQQLSVKKFYTTHSLLDLGIKHLHIKNFKVLYKFVCPKLSFSEAWINYTSVFSFYSTKD